MASFAPPPLVLPAAPTVAATAPRPRLAAHPLASEEGYDLTLDTVDSWAAGYARLQRLLPALQAAAKAPLVALAQTDVGLAELHERVPALHQLPCVAVPHNRADGSWDERLLLGAAWQPVALPLDGFS